MKKVISIVLAFFLLLGVAGCNKENEETPTQKPINIIRDFENFEQIQYGMSVYEYFGKWNLNKDKKFITHGEGSLQINPTGNYRASDVGSPYVRISPESHSGYFFTKDFRKVKAFSFDIYNNTDFEQEIKVVFSYLTGRASWGQPYTLDGEVSAYKLKANAWNNIVIKYDATSLMKKYPIEELHHIDIIFDEVAKDGQIPEYYIDNVILEESKYDNLIDLGLSPSVVKGKTVLLGGIIKDLNNKKIDGSIKYEVTSGEEKVTLSDNMFKAENDKYLIKATGYQKDTIIAENEFVLYTRDKQKYLVIDDFNDYKDSTALIAKNRRGEISFDKDFEREDKTKGALKFKQLREEAGIGFEYSDYWAHRDFIKSFDLQMFYQTQLELDKVPLFKGLFINDGIEYLMYKSSEGTWAHNYSVNKWQNVSLPTASLQAIIDEQNKNPDEAARPASYPALFVGFNTALTDDIDANIYFSNFSLSLKDFEGKTNENISLQLPSFNIDNFNCTIKSVKNSFGNMMPFDQKNKTFKGNSGVYEVSYVVKGDTILDTNIVLKLIINK